MASTSLTSSSTLYESMSSGSGQISVGVRRDSIYPRRMTQRAPQVALWLSLLVACNGRSALETSGQGGGAGAGAMGSGAMGSGAMGSGAMGPGGSAPCAQLVQTGALTALPTLPDKMALQPRLHSLGKGQMAVVHHGGPTGGTATTNIAWTESWPPVISTPFALHDEGGYAAPVGHVGPSGIPLIAGVMAFGFADPQKGGWSQLVVTDTNAFGRQFLADDMHDNYFIGMLASGGFPDATMALHVGWVGVNGTTSYTGPTDLGCLNQPSTADGIAVPGGWLLARSRAECGQSPPNPPTVTLTRYAGAGAEPQLGAEITLFSAVQRLALVPRPAGAWLLYFQSALQGTRLDALGKVELGPVDLVSMGQPYSFGVDAVDGGLIVAVAMDNDLKVSVFDDQGMTIASVSLNEKDQPYYMEPQIAFDEGSRQALLAIAMPDGAGSHRINVARFSCQSEPQ
jgi:hypothetical protein